MGCKSSVGVLGLRVLGCRSIDGRSCLQAAPCQAVPDDVLGTSTSSAALLDCHSELVLQWTDVECHSSPYVCIGTIHTYETAMAFDIRPRSTGSAVARPHLALSVLGILPRTPRLGGPSGTLPTVLEGWKPSKPVGSVPSPVCPVGHTGLEQCLVVL